MEDKTESIKRLLDASAPQELTDGEELVKALNDSVTNPRIK